jgi:hypothetical protein
MFLVVKMTENKGDVFMGLLHATYSPDRTMVCGSCQSGTTTFWNAFGAIDIDKHSKVVVISGTGIDSLDGSPTIDLVVLKDGKRSMCEYLFTLRGHNCVFSPDGRHIRTTYDSAIITYCTMTHEVLDYSIKFPYGSIACTFLAPFEMYLVSYIDLNKEDWKQHLSAFMPELSKFVRIPACDDTRN